MSKHEHRTVAIVPSKVTEVLVGETLLPKTTTLPPPLRAMASPHLAYTRSVLFKASSSATDNTVGELTNCLNSNAIQ
jgi:hypothetical protein